MCIRDSIHTEKSERVARPYALWLAEQNGTYTWKTPIQKDIEEAIAASLTWKQFLRVMEKQGYAFRFDRKYATMILPGTGRTVRFKTCLLYTSGAVPLCSSALAIRESWWDMPVRKPRKCFLCRLCWHTV